MTPGIYQLTSRCRIHRIEVTGQGWRAFYVDGAAVMDKASFLDAFAVALGFPSYFGQNWDALEECLTEMTWALARAMGSCDDVNNLPTPHRSSETALAIFNQAADYWQALTCRSTFVRAARGITDAKFRICSKTPRQTA
ncbi:MAG: barstar family protein [Caldilineaceae bacterium]